MTGWGILSPRTTELRLTIKFEQSLIPHVAQMVVELVANFLPKSAASLVNIKGRDAGEHLFSADLAAQRPQQDEMLYLAGDIFNDDKGIDREPVSFSLISKFKSFTADNGIAFELENRRTGDMPEDMTARLLTRAFPIELKCVRAGLQFFKPRRVPLLGVSPAVVETILVEAADGLCCLSLSGQIRSGHGDAFPLSSAGYQAASEFLSRAFALSLDENWSKALEADSPTSDF